MALIIIIAVLFLIVITGVSLYNSLIKKRNMMQEAWSGIDVILKKRYDLIPNLVNTVKAYAGHEQKVLEEVTSLRTKAIQAATVDQKIGAEQQLSQSLGRLVISAEAYPDLKASANFQELQTQLQAIESELELARRYYNGTVRENNIAIESFPGNMVANSFNFQKGAFFEIDNVQQRENPTVSF